MRDCQCIGFLWKDARVGVWAGDKPQIVGSCQSSGSLKCDQYHRAALHPRDEASLGLFGSRKLSLNQWISTARHHLSVIQTPPVSKEMGKVSAQRRRGGGGTAGLKVCQRGRGQGANSSTRAGLPVPSWQTEQNIKYLPEVLQMEELKTEEPFTRQFRGSINISSKPRLGAQTNKKGGVSP